jgi:hypothetical protein
MRVDKLVIRTYRSVENLQAIVETWKEFLQNALDQRYAIARPG